MCVRSLALDIKTKYPTFEHIIRLVRLNSKMPNFIRHKHIQKKEYSLLTVCQSQRCCSGWAASPAWWCWAECTAQWGSLLEHTAEDTHSLCTLIYHQLMSHLFNKMQACIQMHTNLFHPIIVKDVHVTSRSTSKPTKTHHVSFTSQWQWAVVLCHVMHARCKWCRTTGFAQTHFCTHTRMQDLPSLEESHVKDGRISVHELEQEGFQDEALLEVRFCFRNLWKIDKVKL